MFTKHVETFYGLKVDEFTPDAGIWDANLAYRIRSEYAYDEETVAFKTLLDAFCADPKAGNVKALVIGTWGDDWEDSSQEAIALLVAARDTLKSLEAIFLGDILGEECEASWINQTNVEPLWEAYPHLKEFRVRGGNDLSLGTLRLSELRSLTVETGGLPGNILEEISRANLPVLEHLELWLGDDGYGWDSSIEDLRPILSADLFPSLRYLGLRNFCQADALAAALAEAPVLDRIEVLDLSMGTLGDDGAKALAASSKVAKLKKLDLHHHYMSEEGVAQIQALGIEADVSDRKEADEYGDDSYRYVAVGE